MLSKEEIEKILEQNEDIITYKADKDFRGLTSSERTLLENNSKIRQYIDQLEQENKSLKKGQASLMSSRKKWKNRYYSLKAKNKEAYWKGYIQKQNEAMEICQMCKYRKQYFEKKVEGK